MTNVLVGQQKHPVTQLGFTYAHNCVVLVPLAILTVVMESSMQCPPGVNACPLFIVKNAADKPTFGIGKNHKQKGAENGDF